jgi:hypothetical protein
MFHSPLDKYIKIYIFYIGGWMVTLLPLKIKEHIWFAVKKISPWNDDSFEKTFNIRLEEY